MGERNLVSRNLGFAATLSFGHLRPSSVFPSRCLGLCRRKPSRLQALSPKIRTKWAVTATSSNGPGDDEDDHADYTPTEDEALDKLQRSVPAVKEIDVAVTKGRLLKILSALINLDTQRGKVQQLIQQLEGVNNTPATEAFTELALSGEWVLLFSSFRTLTDGNIRIRKIGQVLDVENKNLRNRAVWSYASADGKYGFWAELNVLCSYKFVGPARMEVAVEDHKVAILPKEGEKCDVPQDMTSVVLQMQRSLPIEFFDPSGLIETTYIEPGFRIARYLGKRLAGVRNVYQR